MKAGVILVVKDAVAGDPPGLNDAVRSGVVQPDSTAEAADDDALEIE
jgi:hypothetical protein